MKANLTQLSSKLASDPRYFQQVYVYTFDFARQEGQRSLGECRYFACDVSHIS